MTRISFLGDTRNRLGESPLWDPRSGSLWWVDCVAGRIACASTDGTVLHDWQYDHPVGCIGLGPDDGLVATIDNSFVLISRDGSRSELAVADFGGKALRFNDGKVDRSGRFFSGTLQTSPDSHDLGGLWRLDCDRSLHMVEQGIRLANGTCFSPAGDMLYFTDSLEGIVRSYSYDPATGELRARRDFISAADLGGIPDGATTDAEGRLWIALVNAQAIACVSPDGRLLDRIDMPIPLPSCPAFGGPGLATLYVTTISDSGLRLRTDHPDGGRILVIEGLGATGIAEVPYHLREVGVA